MKLKLSEQCNEKDGKKECEIEIEENLGLGWKANFIPKTIITVS